MLKENSHVFETQEVYSTLRRIKNQSNIDLYLKWKRGEAQDVSEDMLPNEDEKFIGRSCGLGFWSPQFSGNASLCEGGWV